MTRQNGQPTAIWSAPVPTASAVRFSLIREPMVSSIHIRAPPAPQQKDRSALRSISTYSAPGQHLEQLARRRVDLVVPAEVARVVVGDGPLRRAGALRRSGVSSPSRTSRLSSWVWWMTSSSMPNCAVLVLQGVEAVGAGRDDLLDLVLLERLDVLLGQALEDELVARASRRVTGAGLAVAEDAEADAGQVEQLGDGPRGLLGAVLVGAGAADPEQPVDGVEGLEVLADDGDVEVQALGPVHPRGGRHVPGVALVLQALEQPVQLGREARLHQDLVAPHVDDVVDVLDVDRALLDAGTAGHAGPQHVGVDHRAAAWGATARPRSRPTRARSPSARAAAGSEARADSSARMYGPWRTRGPAAP